MTTTHHPNSPGAPGAGAEQDSGVKETAQQAASTAAQEGRRVADVARDEASNVASEATAQARTLLSDVTAEAEQQTRAQKDRLAGTVRTFGDDLDQMAANGSGLAAEVASQVATRARSLSSQLESREPRELLDEVRTYARRHPGTFLLGALAAGVVAGRLARGAKEATSNSTSHSTSGGTADRSAGVQATPAQQRTSDVPLPPSATPGTPAEAYDAPPAPGTASGEPVAGASGPEAGYGSRPPSPEAGEAGGWR